MEKNSMNYVEKDKEYNLLNKFASIKQGKFVDFWLKYNSDNNTHICLVCNQVFDIEEYFSQKDTIISYGKFVENHKQNHIKKLKVFY